MVSTFYWPTVLWVGYPALTLIPVVAFRCCVLASAADGAPASRILVVTALWLAYALYEG